MPQIELLQAFADDERPRIRDALSDLYRCFVPRSEFIFVGGISIRYNLLRQIGMSTERAFNDIDMITRGPESFNSARINESFWIHHFHVDSPTTDFRIVLIHKATDTKIDVFHWKPAYPGFTSIPFETAYDGTVLVDVQSLSTQFAVTVYDLDTMRLRGPVDPKQLADAKAMLPWRSHHEACNIWRQLFDGQPEHSLDEAFHQAQIRASQEPANFRDSPWKSHDTRYKCAKCAESEDWPIAPMETVIGLLGYVEIDGDNIYELE
jgi:hypothetical protein